MSAEEWGDFEIFLDEVIGKGGMGTVYRGRQISLDRPVAIKVLNEELLEDEQFIKRFQREGMVMGKLSDPHIVQVLGAGEHDDQYYIAMELLEGTTLDELLKQDETFTYRQIVDVGLGVSKAMEAAWEHDIIHRDIKPDNIFLEHGEHVKVMDYGLARTEDTGLTQTGTMMGTYQYMSIEQMEGKEVDVRTDIYSLGLVLYQMVTGIIPGSGKTAAEIYKNRTEQKPPPPGKMSGEIPEPLEDLIMQCVKREPGDRPDEPGMLVSRLEDVVRDEGEHLDQSVHMNTVVDSESVGSGASDSSSLENITTVITEKILFNSVSGSLLVTSALLVLLGTGVLAWYNSSWLKQSFIGSVQVREAKGHEDLYFPSKSLDENVSIGREAMVKNNFEDAEHIFAAALNYAQKEELSRTRTEKIKDLLNQARYEKLKREGMKAEENENWKKALSVWKRAEQIRETDESSQKIEQLKNRLAHQDLSFPGKSLKENVSLGREAKVKENLEDAEEILKNALEFARKENPSLTEKIEKHLAQVRYERLKQKGMEAEKNGNPEEALSFWKQANEQRSTDEARTKIRSLKTRLAKRKWESAVKQPDKQPNWEQLRAAAEELATLHPDREEYTVRRQFVKDVQKSFTAKEKKQWRKALLYLRKWKKEKRIDERLRNTVNKIARDVQTSIDSEISELTDRANNEFFSMNWSSFLQDLDELKRMKGELDSGMKEKKKIAGWGKQTPEDMVFFPGTRFLGDAVPEEFRDVRAFYIDRTEVTVEEYGRFLSDVKNNGHSCPFDELRWLNKTRKEKLSGKDHKPLLWEVKQKERPQHPVTGVDWYDAFCYARWANKRLPLASEWKAVAMYDVRRKRYLKYPWGDSFDPALLIQERIASVRELPEEGASPYGALGMAGNVEEWTRSIEGKKENTSPQSADLIRFLVHGVTFAEGRTESDRASSGVGHTPQYRSISVGIRCVKYPSQE